MFLRRFSSYMNVESMKEEIERLRNSRCAIIIVIYLALVLDNMLLTVVVPIIPDYLYQLEHPTISRDQRDLQNTSLLYSTPTTRPSLLTTLTEVNDISTSVATEAITLIPTIRPMFLTSLTEIHDMSTSVNNSGITPISTISDLQNTYDTRTTEASIIDTTRYLQKKDMIKKPENTTNENGSEPHVSSQQIPEDIISENGRVGLLFSSKAFVQLVVNPLVGPLTAQLGYPLPLLFGTHILIISALLFAYAESYSLLFAARSLQGIASSCIAISGLGLVAECYPDDSERGRMQGLVMGGIATGVLLGYPAGGLLYDFTGSKTPVFLTVAILTFMLVVVQLVLLNPKQNQKGDYPAATPLTGLLKDPYILLTAGAVMVSTTAMAVLEPCLPIWLMDTLHPEKWQLGTAFIPDSIGYLVGTSCLAGPAYCLGRWRVAIAAMILVAFAASTVPYAQSMVSLAGPHFCLGLGVGTVDAALMPLLAKLVDERHIQGAYGTVYAIAQGAVALAYSFGPLVGGETVRLIGFPWLMRCVALMNLFFCPLLLLLRAQTQEDNESQAILMAAPDPHDYSQNYTAKVQPREASLCYQQLFNEEDD